MWGGKYFWRSVSPRRGGRKGKRFRNKKKYSRGWVTGGTETTVSWKVFK